MQLQLDIFSGRQQRDLGIQAATGNEREDWRDAYGKMVDAFFAATPIGQTFTGESLRLNCVRWGLADPHHHNVWGACARGVLKAWLKAGRIEEAGMGQMVDVRSHARRTPMYRKVA